MNAEEFATEFVNDFQENLKNKNINLETNSFYFSKSVYNEDEDLKVLKKKLNEIGYDLILDSIENEDKFWKVIKL